MTDYIVCEGVRLEKNKVPGMTNQIANRLSFLENCIKATDIAIAADIAVHLMNKGSSNFLSK